jgi:hypothetical protein
MKGQGTMINQNTHQKRDETTRLGIGWLLRRMTSLMIRSQTDVPSSTQSSRRHKTIYSI